MYRSQRVLASLVLLSIGLAGCVTQPIGYSDFDTETDFSVFQTFAWLPERALVVSSLDPVNPALEGLLKEETKAYLTRHGFRYSDDPEAADLVIGFAVGGTPTVRTTNFTDNYRQVRIIGSSRSAEVVTQESMDGGLVIDLFDQASGNKKWTGWSITEITSGDRANLRPTIRQLVTIILQHFPPDV